MAAELGWRAECHTIRVQERFQSSGCAHLLIKHRSRVELIDVSSCISQDPYCFKDLGVVFFFYFLELPMVWVFISVNISLRKVSKVLSTRVLAYFPFSKDILSLD